MVSLSLSLRLQCRTTRPNSGSLDKSLGMVIGRCTLYASGGPSFTRVSTSAQHLHRRPAPPGPCVSCAVFPYLWSFYIGSAAGLERFFPNVSELRPGTTAARFSAFRLPMCAMCQSGGAGFSAFVRFDRMYYFVIVSWPHGRFCSDWMGLHRIDYLGFVEEYVSY